ncbi:cytochrome c-type biogenesis protein CcmH [Tistrella mobilis]|uniref:cytochrome c-type biogenesis protein n=1 Tax=Tistrella mobilis TaxID=171437 RepID=UPI003556A5D4
MTRAACLAIAALLAVSALQALAQQTDAPAQRAPQEMPAPGSVAPGPLAQPEIPLADPAEERRAREISKELRCLVCQNQSIEDSNAELARDLRQVVREQVAAGRSRDDILTFMVDRYGDWILMRPPVKSTTYLLWAAPAVALLVGAAIAIGFIRRQRRAYTARAAEDGFARPLDDEEAWRLARLLDETGNARAGTDEIFDPAPDKTAPTGAAPADTTPSTDATEAGGAAPDASGSDEADTPPKDGRPQK